MERVKIVSERIDKIKPILKECGFKNPAIAFSGKKLIELSDLEFQKIVDWFNHFDRVILNYFDRKGLRTEEQWEAYRIQGITDLTEIRLLKLARKVLRETWFARPPILTRNRPIGKPQKKNRKKVV